MISLVIPIHNQWRYTEQFLQSLSRHTPTEPWETIIVDNGSRDESREALSAYPDVKVIRNESNRGCAQAWNQGWRASKGSWVGFLNNDIVLSAGWLEGLLYTASHHRLDIVGPVHLEGELDYNLDALAREFSQKHRSKLFKGFNACCFLVRRSVLEMTGGFDERYHKGKYEDSDFVLRALKGGFRVGLSGAVLIHHFGSRTVQALPEMAKAEEENRKRFIEKWGRGPDFKRREFRRGILERMTFKRLAGKRKAYSLRKGEAA
jgi:N-acetylglucosaminyl-diphospho-decaprenol L-rhamnosyltransferase